MKQPKREYGALAEASYEGQAEWFVARLRAKLAQWGGGDVVITYKRIGAELHITGHQGERSITHVDKLATIAFCDEYEPRTQYRVHDVVTVDSLTLYICLQGTSSHPLSGSGHWGLLGAVPEPEFA